MKAARWSLRRTISYNRFHLGVKRKGARSFFGGLFCKCDVVKNYGRLVGENPRFVYALLCESLFCFDFQPCKLSGLLDLDICLATFVLLSLFGGRQ